MALAKRVVHENDVVALLGQVGDWPAGTVGAAVSRNDGASLVEVTDGAGCTLDLFSAADELLENQPCYVDDASGQRGSLMEASGPANRPSADPQA